jgi:hypothetical protein
MKTKEFNFEGDKPKGVRPLHGYIMKTKEFNFEGVRVGKAESSCEPSVGSAGGVE